MQSNGDGRLMNFLQKTTLLIKAFPYCTWTRDGVIKVFGEIVAKFLPQTFGELKQFDVFVSKGDDNTEYIKLSDKFMLSRLDNKIYSSFQCDHLVIRCGKMIVTTDTHD